MIEVVLRFFWNLLFPEWIFVRIWFVLFLKLLLGNSLYKWAFYISAIILLFFKMFSCLFEGHDHRKREKQRKRKRIYLWIHLANACNIWSQACHLSPHLRYRYLSTQVVTCWILRYISRRLDWKQRQDFIPGILKCAAPYLLTVFTSFFPVAFGKQY